MVFSCLEVILKQMIEQGKLTVRCEEDREKNGSATCKAIIHLLVVAHEHEMNACTQKN